MAAPTGPRDQFTSQDGSDTSASCAVGPIQLSAARNNSPTTSHPVMSNTSLYTIRNTTIKVTQLKTYLTTYKKKKEIFDQRFPKRF